MTFKEILRNCIDRVRESRIDSVLGALAIGPPAYGVFELSTPMLFARTPSYPELYTAYRHRRTLATIGLGAGATLLWRTRSSTDNTGVAKGTAVALAGLASVTPLIYDPLVFKPRENTVKVRQPEEAPEVLPQNDTEVIGVRLNGEARAYPVRKAARPHLLVDTLGGERIVVTYCGLTNSAIVYRPKNGREPDLSVVSAPNNNILYWDANTNSLVQQLLSDPAYGPATDDLELHVWPVTFTTWSAWRNLVPHTTVADPQYESLRDRVVSTVMRPTHMRTRVDEEPFLAVAGEVDHTVHPKTRIFALEEGGDARAYTHDFLRTKQIVTTSIGGQPVVIFYDGNYNIAKAYRNELDEQQLSFESVGEGEFRDNETETQWDVLGRAASGPYAGQTLEPVPFSFEKIFWFAWKQYQPETELVHLSGATEEPETADIGPRTAE
jgi:hypothetical protein